MKRIALTFGLLASLLAVQLTGCSDNGVTRIDPALTRVDLDAAAETDHQDALDALQEAQGKPAGTDRLLVDAGALQYSDANLLVRLQGSVETLAGQNLARTQWSQIEGPEARILADDQLNTAVLLPDVDQILRLTFRLTAMDGEAYVASDTLGIMVQPVNAEVQVLGAVGLESDAEITFRVRLLQAAQQAMTFDYTTADRSAEAGKDYLETLGELTFDAGEQEKTVSVPLLNDDLLEGDEYFVLNISLQGAEPPLTASGVGVIIDDETGESIQPSKPVASPIDRSQAELGEPTGTIRVHLTWPSAANDLNLHVTDPCDNVIYTGNRLAACSGLNGRLDADSADEGNSTPAENIYWGNGAAGGEYRVSVEHFSGQATPYTVYVYHGGEGYMFKGVAGSGATDLVFTFRYNPLVEVISPAPGSVVDGDVTLSGRLEAANVSSLRLRINNGDAIDLLDNLDRETNRFNLRLPASLFDLGRNTLEITIGESEGVFDRTVTNITYSPLSKPAGEVVVDISSPVDGVRLFGRVNIAGTVSAEGGEIAQLQAFVNGEESPLDLFNRLMDGRFVFSLDGSQLQLGDNSVRVRATDSAANSGEGRVEFTYEQAPEATAPRLSVTAPQNDAILRGDTITFRGIAIAEHSELTSLQMVIGDGQPQSLLDSVEFGDFLWAVPGSAFEAGANTVVFTAASGELQSEPVTVTFTYEPDGTAQPLILTLLNPAEDASVSSNVPVFGRFEAPNGIASLDARLNDEISIPLFQLIQDDRFAFSLAAQQLLLGANRLTLSATDSAENRTSAELSFTFDPTLAPAAGGDLVVINDLDIFTPEFFLEFDGADNAAFIANLATFSHPTYLRANAERVLFERARSSICAESCATSIAATRDLLEQAGFTVEEVDSSDFAVMAVPADVKVLVFWLPETPLSTEEAATLKQFAREGGRIVLVGDDEEIYPAYRQNQILAALSASMRNSGGVNAPGTLITVAEPEHQITRQLGALAVNEAAALEVGIADYALITTTAGDVLAAVSTINFNDLAPEYRGPGLVLTSPISNSQADADTRISGRVALADGALTAFEVQLNGELIHNDLPQDGINSFDLPLPIGELAAGENLLEVTVSDANGGTVRQSVTFNYQPPTPPTINITSPSAATELTDTVLLLGQASVEGGRIETLVANINGEEVPLQSSAAGQFRLPITDYLQLGENTVTVSATSSAGLTAAESLTFGYFVPSVPLITIASPADGEAVQDEVTVSGSATVQGAEIEQLLLQVSGSEALDITASLAAGNFSYTLSEPLGSGVSSIRVTAVSSQGERNYRLVRVNYRLPMAPVVTIISPEDGTAVREGFTLAGTVVHDGDALAGLQVFVNDAVIAELDADQLSSLAGSFSLDLDVAELEEGDNEIRVRAEDSDGRSASDILNLTYIAPQAPILTITHPMDRDSVQEGFTLSGTVALTSGNVELLTLQINETAPRPVEYNDADGVFSYDIQADDLVGGDNSITVRAQSTAGLTTSVSVTVTYNAPSIPQVVIEAPEDGETLTDESVTLTGTASVEFGRIVALRAVVGEETTNLLNNFSNGRFTWVVPAAQLHNGANTVTVSAVNNAGDIGADTVTFDYAVATAPVVSITAPLPGEVPLQGELLFTGSVDDVQALVELTVNGEAPVAMALDASGAFSLDVSEQLTRGSNTLLVTATGATGLTGSDSVTFDYRIPYQPEVQINAPVDGDELSGEVLLTGSAAVEDADIVELILLVNGEARSVITNALVDGEFSVDITSQLGGGGNTIRVTGLSSDGLAAFDEVSVSYSVPMAPSVTIIAPLNEAEILTDLDVRVQVLHGEALERIELIVNGTVVQTLTDDEAFAGPVDGDFAFVIAATNLSPGENTLRVTATGLNELAGGDERVIVYLPPTPVVEITSPEEGDALGDLVLLRGTVNLAVGELASVIVEINGEPLPDLLDAAFDGSFQLELGADQLANGDNTIRVIAHTDAEQSGSQSVSFSYAYALPEPSVEIVTPEEAAVIEAGFTLQGNVSLASGSIVELLAIINSGPAIDLLEAHFAGGEFSFEVPAEQLLEGENVLEVLATTDAGLTTLDDVTVFYRPTVNLSLLIETPVNGDEQTGDLTLSGSAVVDNGELDTLIAVINDGPPIDLLNSLSDGRFSYELPPLSSGAYTILVIAESGMTRREAQVSFDYRAAEVPVITIATPVEEGPVQRGSVELTGQVQLDDTASLASLQLSLNDAEDPVELLEFVEDGQFSYSIPAEQLAEGRNLIRLVATDSRQNRSIPAEVNLVYQAPIAPVVSLDSPEPEMTYTADALLLSGSFAVDDGAELVRLQATITRENGEPWVLDLLPTTEDARFSATLTREQLPFGEYTLVVTAEDSRGLSAPAVSVAFVYRAAAVAPEVSITAPTADSEFRGGDVTVEGWVETNSSADLLSLVVVAVAGDDVITLAELTPVIGNFSVVLNEQQLAYGEQILRVVATDTFGQEGVDELAIHYREPQPPVVEFSRPTPAAVISGASVSVEGSFSLDGGAELSSIAARLVQNDDIIPLEVTNVDNGSFSFVLSPPQLQQGPARLEVTVTDDGGYSTTSGLQFTYSASRTLDVVITSPTPRADIALGGELTVSGTATGNIASLTAQLYQGLEVLVGRIELADDNSFTAVFSTEGLFVGDATVAIDATDELGVMEGDTVHILFVQIE